MYLNLNSLQAKVFYFKEQIHFSLTSQQKKILVIATMALSCIAAIYLFCKYCFKAKEKDQNSLKAENQKTVAQNEKILSQPKQKQEPQLEQKAEQTSTEEPVGEPKAEQPEEKIEVEQMGALSKEEPGDEKKGGD